MTSLGKLGEYQCDVGDHPEDVGYLVWWVTFLGLVGDYQGDSWLPSFGR